MSRIRQIAREALERIQQLDENLNYPPELIQEAEEYLAYQRSQNPYETLDNLITTIKLYGNIYLDTQFQGKQRSHGAKIERGERIAAYLESHKEKHQTPDEKLSSNEQSLAIEQSMKDIILHIRDFYSKGAPGYMGIDEYIITQLHSYYRGGQWAACVQNLDSELSGNIGYTILRKTDYLKKAVFAHLAKRDTKIQSDISTDTSESKPAREPKSPNAYAPRRKVKGYVPPTR